MPTGSPGRPTLHTWRHAPVLGLAAMALFAGFGQFGAVAALGDVAEGFGEATSGASVAEQAGLSGTVLGVGLAVIRVASLGGLPLAGVADRLGRRRTVVGAAAIGLSLTVVAAASPGYWWFVAGFALSRPFLTATTAVAQVAAAEHTASRDRAKAIAVVSAGYGVGAGLVALARGVASGPLGFRGVFALAAVPLALLPVVRRRLTEPERFLDAQASADRRLPILGAVPAGLRRRLGFLGALAFASGFVTAPANSFLFLFAEDIVGVSTGVTAAMVVAAAPVGLAGLLLGRAAADVVGRRPAAACALACIAVAGVVTYRGDVPAVVGGYLLAVLAGSAFAPAAGALATELFPTPVRATVTGWLVAAGVLGAVSGLLAFGAAVDAFDRFAPAALVVSVPVLLATGLFALVPETRGLELEESSR